MSDDREEVVLNGMWQSIKALYEILNALGPMLEWFYDQVPDERKEQAAKNLDIYQAAMKDCDALVAPMRKIMEGDK